MEDWTVLETFTSEAEARVAESFLRAQGFEVQLLDTHMNAYPPVSSTIAGRGMRLLVRTADGERACELLKVGRRGSHLEVVGEIQPIQRSAAERWLFWLLLALLGMTIAVSYLRAETASDTCIYRKPQSTFECAAGKLYIWTSDCAGQPYRSGHREVRTFSLVTCMEPYQDTFENCSSHILAAKDPCLESYQKWLRQRAAGDGDGISSIRKDDANSR